MELNIRFYLNATAMKKSLTLLLLFLYGYSVCITAKSTFKIIQNKKISSKGNYDEHVNLFQCFNNCEKKAGCRIFNHNSKLKICQLVDGETNENFDDIIHSNEWNIYFPTTRESVAQRDNEMAEVMELKNQTSDRQIDTGIENATNLSICFWFKQSEENKGTFYTIYTENPCSYIFLSFEERNNRLEFEAFSNFYGIKKKDSFVLTKSVSSKRFFHVCLVYSNKVLFYYVNGKQRDKTTLQKPGNTITVKFLRIGQAFTYDNNCRLDSSEALRYVSFYDFNIYPERLSVPEIADLMNGNYTVSPVLSWEKIKSKYRYDNNVIFKVMSISEIKNKN